MVSRVRIPADSAQHARMGEATTQDSSQRIADLTIGGARICVENGFSGEDYAAETISALGRSLSDECLLNGMRLLRCTKAFERRDFI